MNLENTIALLSRTPAALDAFLRGLPDEWTKSNEGGDSWSPYDIVGHLIHGEVADWIPRARMILEHGESRPFEKFDRLAQQRNSAGKSLSQLLDEFASLRAQSLATLKTLDTSQLEKRGLHPELGTVTLGHLLATWVAHDLTHLHQLSRVMAHQVRDEVGPWDIYLGVMRCAGHSD